LVRKLVTLNDLERRNDLPTRAISAAAELLVCHRQSTQTLTEQRKIEENGDA